MTSTRCLALPSIHFPSIYNFQNYFCHESSLTLLANQSLWIGNIPSQFTELVTGRSLQSSEEEIEKVKGILSKMLLPLGVTLSIEGARSREISWSIQNYFSLQGPSAMVLKKMSGIISTSLSELFQIMIYSSRLKATFEPFQWLEVRNVIHSELDPNKPQHSFHRIAAKEIPTGYKYLLLFKASGMCSSINPEQETFTITSSRGMEISLLCTEQCFTLSSFAKMFAEKKNFTLIPGQKLRIQDPAIAHLHRQYIQKYNYFFTPISYFLNHLFLHLEKRICESGSPIQYRVDGTCIEFTSEERSTLKLTDGDLYLEICNFSESFISSLPSIEGDTPVFKTSQPLHIYGIAEEEVEELSELQASTNTGNICKIFDRFLSRRAPVGFFWNYAIRSYRSEIIEYTQEGKKCYLWKLSPRAASPEIKFWLHPLNNKHPWILNCEELWILGVFNRSSPQFVARFFEDQGDVNLMEMLLIKMILHYCTIGRHYIEIPPFLTDEIIQELLLLCDQYPCELLRNLLLDIYDRTLSNSDFRSQQPFIEIPPLFDLTSEEFPGWKLESLSKEGKELMTTLLKIATSAHRNPSFIDAMNAVCTGIQNGTYLPFFNKENLKRLIE